jgi:hypothetical protein
LRHNNKIWFLSTELSSELNLFLSLKKSIFIQQFKSEEESREDEQRKSHKFQDSSYYLNDVAELHCFREYLDSKFGTCKELAALLIRCLLSVFCMMIMTVNDNNTKKISLSFSPDIICGAADQRRVIRATTKVAKRHSGKM